MTTEELQKAVFRINDDKTLQSVALAVFRYQLQYNSLYTSYCRHIGLNPDAVISLEQIPFFPIEFFRTHKVLSSNRPVNQVFTSSGTTGLQNSRHHVVEPDMYIQSFTRTFTQNYGNPADYCILALLPSYMERKDSSLVFMANHLLKASKHPYSGFYLNNLHELKLTLQKLRDKGDRTILLGVSFALLDLAENYPVHFPELIIIETGGMKGRRREMVREELHQLLKEGFGVKKIHSEYGMTELLSQAYSKGDGIFQSPPWMRILIRDVNDPLSLIRHEKTGGINVVDLANLYSCAFIATQDLGKLYDDGRFEVLGRFDHSDVRGCNLMVTL